jgi:hypothetical protein
MTPNTYGTRTNPARPDGAGCSDGGVNDPDHGRQNVCGALLND